MQQGEAERTGFEPVNQVYPGYRFSNSVDGLTDFQPSAILLETRAPGDVTGPPSWRSPGQLKHGTVTADVTGAETGDSGARQAAARKPMGACVESPAEK